MLFDLVGSKIMTVYVAEIKGRGIAAFHANNGSDAERLVRDRVFRDDFMVLATGGLPLWDGVTDIEVRLARPDEEVKWRASRATARLCGETQIEHWKPFRHPLQAIDLYDVGAPKDARQIAVAARIESDAKHVDPPMSQRHDGLSRILDEVAPIAHVDVPRLAIGHHQQQTAMGELPAKLVAGHGEAPRRCGWRDSR